MLVSLLVYSLMNFRNRKTQYGFKFFVDIVSYKCVFLKCLWCLNLAWMAKINLGLKRFFFFWLGHELGPSPKRDPRGPAGASSGPGKKPSTLNGPGPGHGSCPVGRVRVWKNPARTLPVAIPRNGNPLISPRIEFRPIPRRFGNFSQFQSIPAEIQDPTGALFGLHLSLKQREKTKS